MSHRNRLREPVGIRVRVSTSAILRPPAPGSQMNAATNAGHTRLVVVWAGRFKESNWRVSVKARSFSQDNDVLSQFGQVTEQHRAHTPPMHGPDQFADLRGLRVRPRSMAGTAGQKALGAPALVSDTKPQGMRRLAARTAHTRRHRRHVGGHIQRQMFRGAETSALQPPAGKASPQPKTNAGDEHRGAQRRPGPPDPTWPSSPPAHIPLEL